MEVQSIPEMEMMKHQLNQQKHLVVGRRQPGNAWAKILPRRYVRRWVPEAYTFHAQAVI